MSAGLALTKEMLAAAGALVVGGLLLVPGDGPRSAGRPLPRVPALEAAAEVARSEVPVLEPRLLVEAPGSEGRNPFAATSVWERPLPDPLGPPPERPRGRLVPLLAVGGARAHAPRAPRLDLAAVRAQAEGVDLADLGDEDATGAPTAPVGTGGAGSIEGPLPGAPEGWGDTRYQGIELREHDLLYLKDVAEPVKGILVEETRDAFIFRKDGSASPLPYDKGLVARLDRAPRAETVHQQESQRLRGDDVAGRLNLVRFCLAHGLHRQAREEALAAARHAGTDPVPYRLAAAAARAEYGAVTAAYHSAVRERELRVYELAAAAGALDPGLRLARARLLREEGVREAALQEIEAALAALVGASGPGSGPASGSPIGSEAGSGAEGEGGGSGNTESGSDDGEGDAGGAGSGSAAGEASAGADLALEVRLELGDLALGLGRPADAARAYAAAAAEGGSARAHLGLALARFAEGKLAEAEAAIEAAREEQPSLAAVEVLAGQALLFRGQAVEALRRFDAARKLGDRGVERLAWQGLALALLGEKTRARALIERAVLLEPSGELRLIAAFLDEVDDRADEAAKLYAEIEEDGGRAAGLAGMAVAELWLARGAPGEAEASFVRAARQGYDFADAAEGIALVRRRSGDAAKAVRFARYAEAARPTDGALAYEVGLCYLALGNDGEAEAAFTRAAQRLPGDPYPLAGLGRTAFGRGEHAAAELRFREALARAPGHAFAEEGVRKLEVARARRVWRDDFERPDQDLLHNRWKEEEQAGVKAGLRGGRLVLAGEASRPDAVAEAVREDDREQLAAFRATLTMPVPAARAGILVRTRDGEVRLYRGEDGLVRYQLRASGRPLEAPVEVGRWADGAPHELEIAVGGRERNEVVVSLDRREVGRAKATYFQRRSSFQCAVYAEAAQGAKVEVACDEASVFVDAR